MKRNEAKKLAVGVLINHYNKSGAVARFIVKDSAERAARMVKAFSDVTWLDAFLDYTCRAIAPGCNPVPTYEFLGRMEHAQGRISSFVEGK